MSINQIVDDDFLADIISVKSEPELRHALAHMYYAIEALCKGHKREALYELKSIESLIFWEDDEHMSAHVEGINHEKLQKEKVLQGQEELQGQEIVDNFGDQGRSHYLNQLVMK